MNEYEKTAYKFLDTLKGKLKTQGFDCIDSKNANVQTKFGKTLCYFYCVYPKLNVPVDQQNHGFAKTLITMCKQFNLKCKFDTYETNGRDQLVFQIDLDDQDEKMQSIYTITYDFAAGVVALSI